ncbi:hypothetical protein PITC_055970 [Penicillium italicum]|uniref:Uncharacterized protein n=1 Tax=Penicillium italicum TaxID=40296 RepID=A0A0A2KGK1_PENIT|nr:hypothetical protein PITC_055970 [Penicillium italicum]
MARQVNAQGIRVEEELKVAQKSRICSRKTSTPLR